jgi:hypothetical protein
MQGVYSLSIFLHTSTRDEISESTQVSLCVLCILLMYATIVMMLATKPRANERQPITWKATTTDHDKGCNRSDTL